MASLATTTRLFTTNAAPAAPTDRRTIVVSGPSGGGKSTLLERLFREYPNTFGFSVSHTTRKPRPGEVDGVAYHFVTHATINDMIAKDQFLEHAVYASNTYGTSRKAVQDIKDSGKICIMDIELQGVKQIRELARKSREEGGGGVEGFEARYLLVRPPSLEVLEARLRARKTESEDAIQKRLEAARREWDAGSDPGNFECIVVNDDLDTAYRDLHRFIFGATKVE
ncbi:hypothetical protein BGZ89_008683 [Linnemannia elongata]|nr:hypothetical protein BGZ89_008683 [Linnemannia elongata]KAK5798772.1 guanylate kinase-like protein [Linnemannia elongata]